MAIEDIHRLAAYERESEIHLMQAGLSVDITPLSVSLSSLRKDPNQFSTAKNMVTPYSTNNPNLVLVFL